MKIVIYLIKKIKQQYLKFCLMFCCIGLCLTAFGAIYCSDDWNKATHFYQQKKYDSAVHLFQNIALLKIENPELYFNIGNCYYALNQPEYAILYFEKALKRKSDFKAAENNIVLAQNRLGINSKGYKELFVISWWKTLTQPCKSDYWAIVFMLNLLLILGIFYYKNKWMYFNKTLVFLVLTLLLFLFFTYQSFKNSTINNSAIIISSACNLYKEESCQTTNNTIAQGYKVEIIERKTNKFKVLLPDTREGWIKTETCQIID